MSGLRPARVAAGTLLAFATTLVPLGASAHPLGNFSINHYNGLVVGAESIVVDHVLDLSEIPTFSVRAAMDADADGEIADDEAVAWAASTCATAADTLRLSQDGVPLPGSVASSAAEFRPGQGALTSRLECRIEWPLAARLSEGDASHFSFHDESYAERIGWREIVVGGDGAAIVASDAPTTTISDRLLAYPADPLADPARQLSATFAARASAATPATPTAPGADERSVSSVADGLTAELAALLEGDDVDALALLVGLAIAFGLGALHALSPGHGKTVMAAYLVGSRGTIRTAVALGLVVTVTHTAGVLILGVLTLGAAGVVPVERLYPVLGLVSGLIVLALGAYLLWGRLAAMRPVVAASHDPRGHEHTRGEEDGAHAHGHTHAAHHEHDPQGHEHPHEHAHGHEPEAGSHEHGHEPEASAHAHGHEPENGAHAHGPFRHRHALPDRGSGWRGLASLGLAGGMVPSASALILLLGAVSAGRPELGIVLTLAFGAGMALVLAGVGVAVIVGRGAALRLGGSRVPARIVGAVPALAGGLVIVVGLVMTAQALASLELISLG